MKKRSERRATASKTRRPNSEQRDRRWRSDKRSFVHEQRCNNNYAYNNESVMSNYNEDIYYNNTDYAALEGVPLIDAKKPAKKASSASYPGNRRTVLSNTAGPPADTVLIRTAGNALQAVPRGITECTNVMAVSVPENMRPGDKLLVQTPGTPPQLVEAVIPASAYPGSTFFVEIPETKDTPVVSVTGVAVPDGEEHTAGAAVVNSTDLHLNVTTTVPDEEPSPQPAAAAAAPDQDPNLVLAQVPPGAAPGSKIRVQAADGRTVEATVPNDPTVTQFYVRVPPPSSAPYNV